MKTQLPNHANTPPAAAARTTSEPGSASAPTSAPQKGSKGTAGAPHRFDWKSFLSIKNISALYVLALIVVVFSFWAPETFPTMATFKQVFNSTAVIGIAALALAIPLSARVFDLSFAYTMSLSGVVTAFLVVRDWPLAWAVAIAMLAALLVGLINAVVVVLLRVDSMIGTLATGSIIQALITMVTNDINISDVRLSDGFADIGQTTVLGFTLPVFYMLGIATIVWFVLEHTPVGRRLYATGFNGDAARLSGIPINRYRFVSLLVSASVAGIAGISLASTLGTGSPSAGTAYLLPAFAAAFLGATQLKRGRFNSWGTVIGVLTLGAGTTGLSLAAAPGWSANMFTGLVLIISLAFFATQTQARKGGPSRSLSDRVRALRGPRE